ncbi:MAG: hypothetical protein HZB26_05020 [Candidatus Hydrogenedentes bacterium]|nr:hypothetical protein [Candidatus Hydrogenedentota bacterium]
MLLNSPRILVKAAVAGLIGCVLLVIYVGVTSTWQSRATYPGGLIFIGYRNGGAIEYVRLFAWKPADYTDELPAMTVHVDGNAYPLSGFSPEVAASLGGTLDTGALWDSEGWLLQYRFEKNRLTYVSLMQGIASQRPGERPKPGGNVHSTPFSLSLNGGPPFALPVSQRELTAKAGKPETIRWHIPN